MTMGRRWARTFALVLLAATLSTATPARAGSSGTLSLLDSTIITGTAQGASISVRNLKDLLVFVDVTASSGPPTLDLYLQASSDGGTTWFDLTYEWSQETTVTPSATEGAVRTANRDIVNGLNAAAPKRYTARYMVVGDYVRVAYVVSGATSYTVTVKAIGKS